MKMEGVVKERVFGIARVYYRRRGFKQGCRWSRKLNKRAHEYKKGSVHTRESMCRGMGLKKPERGLVGTLLEIAQKERKAKVPYLA